MTTPQQALADFVSKQKPLPADMAKIVADNMGSLYDAAPSVPYGVWRQGFDAVRQWKEEQAAPANDELRRVLIEAYNRLDVTLEENRQLMQEVHFALHGVTPPAAPAVTDDDSQRIYAYWDWKARAPCFGEREAFDAGWQAKASRRRVTDAQIEEIKRLADEYYRSAYHDESSVEREALHKALEGLK